MKVLVAWLTPAVVLILPLAGLFSVLTLLLSNVVTSIDVPAFGFWESFWIVLAISLWRLPASLAKALQA